MEARRSRTIEITVLSAENLCMNHKPIRKNAYVVVQTQSSSSSNNWCTTRMATEGGSYPSWNEQFLVELLDAASYITLEVQCKTWLGVRSVGAAQVAVSDFLGGVVPESFLKFLSYRLWDRRGKRNGIINFSVRVKTPAKEEQEEASSSRQIVSGNNKKSGGGFQMPEAIMGENDSNGVVTGIPVSWNNYPVNVPRRV